MCPFHLVSYRISRVTSTSSLTSLTRSLEFLFLTLVFPCKITESLKSPGYQTPLSLVPFCHPYLRLHLAFSNNFYFFSSLTLRVLILSKKNVYDFSRFYYVSSRTSCIFPILDTRFQNLLTSHHRSCRRRLLQYFPKTSLSCPFCRDFKLVRERRYSK